MRQKSSRELRYISNKKMAFISDEYSMKKARSAYFYDIVINNREKTFEELLSILSDKMSMEMDKETISKMLKEMKTMISVTKAQELTYIINLMILKNSDRKDKIKYYEEKLLEIEKTREEKVEKTMNSLKRKEEKKEEKKEKHAEEIKAAEVIMDRVINDDEDIDRKELIKKVQFIKRNLKEIDKDKYLDFIFKYNNIESFSREELLQLSEVLNYFIVHLDKNIERIHNLNEYNEEEIVEASKLPVDGEESLDEAIKAKPRRLLRWKLTKMEKRLETYSLCKEILDGVIEQDDLSGTKRIDTPAKRQLLEQEEFVADFFINLKNANDSYNMYIKNLVNIAPNDYENLNNNFKKRLIK